MRAAFWRSHRWLTWLTGGLLVVLSIAGIAVTIAVRRAAPLLRALVVSRLESYFHARVDLDSFHVVISNGLWAEGKGLRIWPPAQAAGVAVRDGGAGTKPLIELQEFRFRAPLHYERGKPIRISLVELRGLTVDVPPGPFFTHKPEAGATASAASQTSPSRGSPFQAPPFQAPPSQAPPSIREAVSEGEPAPGASTSGLPAAPSGSPTPGAAGPALLRFLVDKVVCTDVHITVETANPAKLPLEFEVRTLNVNRIERSGALGFEAVLTNPRPTGLITTQGALGPWMVEDPGTTPVAGNYRFDHADLGVFKGISGTLTSTGKYQGTLRELIVDGETDTPNFALSRFGTTVPLHTTFHARVDATDGDTWLDPVDATLGRSHFTASGKIVGERGGCCNAAETACAAGGKPAAAHQIPHSAPSQHAVSHPAGHDISLMVHVEHGRIEDFLRLTSRTGNPLLTAELHMRTSLEIRPGPAPIPDRLELKGDFLLDGAHFSNATIQDRVGDLSLRGQGKPKEAKSADAGDIHSTMQSDFTMAGGIVDLPDLKYIVPGVEIDMAGKYGVNGGTLAFKGVAKMHATVSEMVGGWKGALLKPADRFFKKDGAGTEIHIHVDGTREDPKFGIDLRP